MTDARNKMLRALCLVVASARRIPREPGVIITLQAFNAAQDAITTKDMVLFADGELGCSSCGAYADDSQNIVHLPGCSK